MEDVKSLFLELQKSNPIKAQIVGRNLFLKSPSDSSSYELYSDFCLNYVNGENNDLSFRHFLLQEVKEATSLFCDQCEITKDNLNLIDRISERYVLGGSLLERNERSFYIAQNKNLLDTLKDQITREFSKSPDSALKEITQLDEKLEKDLFTDSQEKEYKELTDLLSEKVKKNMELKDRKANQDALHCYKKAFDLFNSDNKYKKEQESLAVLGTYLNKYEVQKLSSSVQLYYNYVVSFIFSKLDDDMKYRFVEMTTND